MPAYDPTAEGDGQYVVAFIESAGEVSPVFQRKVRSIFEKHLSGINADQWYPVEDLAAAFEEIDRDVGEQTLEQGGIESTRTAPYPDHVSSPEEAFEALIEVHRAAYRNGTGKDPAGNYTCEVSGRSARVGILEGYPYPPAFAKGVFKQIPRRFGNDDASPTLDSVEPRPSEICAWEMQW
jgi:hypothetical protein